MNAAEHETRDLESSYRRLLRLLPPSYRATHEDELLTVLMDRARPAQTRATTTESLDLLGSAAKRWVALAFGSDRSVRRDAASVMALLLPALLLYPVGKIARLVVLFAPEHYLRVYLGQTPDWPSWLLWGLINVLLLLRLARPARWLAPAATGLCLVAWSHQLLTDGPNTFIHASGWLLVQVVATALLLTPVRVDRGYRLVSRPWHWVAAFAFLALGYAQATLTFRSIGEVLGVATVLAVGLLLWGFRSPTGRVVVPVLGAMAAFMVAVRLWAGHVATDQSGALSWITATDGLLVIGLPVIVLLVLRSAGSLVTKVRMRAAVET